MCPEAPESPVWFLSTYCAPRALGGRCRVPTLLLDGASVPHVCLCHASREQSPQQEGAPVPTRPAPMPTPLHLDPSSHPDVVSEFVGISVRIVPGRPGAIWPPVCTCHSGQRTVGPRLGTGVTEGSASPGRRGREAERRGAHLHAHNGVHESQRAPEGTVGPQVWTQLCFPAEFQARIGGRRS